MTGRVACVGHAVLDHVFNVPSLSLPPGKNFSTNRREVGGGLAATAAVAVARLGGEARLFSRLGVDGVGDTVKEQLVVEGVVVDGCRQFQGRRSSCSAVLVDPEGERLIVNDSDPDMPVSADWLPLPELIGCGAVLADPRWVEGGVTALSAAKAAGRPAVLDAERGSVPVPKELIAAADHVIFSTDGLAQLADADFEPEQLQRFAPHARVSAVTLGGEGVAWLEEGDLHRLPAFSVPVVDTLGAGDVFHGAYALAMARSMPIRDAMRFASAAAALKCTKPGGREGIPTAASLETFMKDNPL